MRAALAEWRAINAAASEKAAPQPATKQSFPEIPGYRLEQEIGRGGQAIVYRALQESTGQPVALKVLPAAISDVPRTDRFRREIQALGSLRHRAVVRIHDAGETGTHLFIAMELVAGKHLSDYVRTRKCSTIEIIELMIDACEAVDAAHSLGIVHRDLKPGNLMVEPNGQVRVLDFGLAKMLNDPTADLTRSATGPGQFYGTRAWASPEQIDGSKAVVSPRTDVYALGLTLYHALTDRFPYDVESSPWIAADSILHADPVPPRRHRPDLDRELQAIILTCLRKDSAQRYVDAGALGADLRRYLKGHSIAARADRWHGVLLARTRRWIGINATLARAIGILGAFGIAYLMIMRGPLAPLDRQLEQWITIGRTVWQPEVVVVTLTDETHIRATAIAAREQLANVDPSVATGMRPLHGRLVHKLVDAGARVIAWNIFFEATDTGHDSELLAGFERAASAGVKTILATRAVTSDYAPRLHPRLVELSDSWGWAGLSQRADGSLTTGVWLLDTHPQLGQQPGLALAAYIQYRWPDDRVRVRWNETETVIDLQPKHDPRTCLIPFPSVMSGAAEGFPAGFDVTFRHIPYIRLALPPERETDRYTVPMHDVFAMSRAQLADRFADKAVFIGDARKQTVPNADNECRIASRTEPRRAADIYAHAQAFCNLLGQRTFARASLFIEAAALFAAALLGAAIAPGTRSRRVVRVLIARLVVCVGILVLTAAALLAGMQFLIPVSASAVAFGLAAAASLLVRQTEMRAHRLQKSRPIP